MVISELEAKLKALREEHGDLPVVDDCGIAFQDVGYRVDFANTTACCISTDDHSIPEIE